MDAESDLRERCQRGEAAAWDELFDTHYAAAGRFIFQLSSDFSPEDAEEICQDVFLSVIKNLETFAGESRLQTWIFRIAVNKARDFRERRNAAKRGGGQMPVSLQAENPETGLLPDPPSSRPGPDEVLMSEESAGMLHDALGRLDPSCREIVELRYFGDLSYEELSSALKLNPKTVSSRLSKCLDRLEEIARKIFPQENPDFSRPTN